VADYLDSFTITFIILSGYQPSLNTACSLPLSAISTGCYQQKKSNQISATTCSFTSLCNMEQNN